MEHSRLKISIPQTPEGEKMLSLRGQKLWVMFHTYRNGHQIEPYAEEVEAYKHAAQIALDYASDKHDNYIEAHDAFSRKEFALVLKLIVVSEIDDRCNVEVMELAVQ